MNWREKYIALETIVRREVTRFTRIWSQTLLPPVITQSLYFIIFGKFIGSQLSSIQGLTYMSFIVPGLVMMAVINSSYSNVVSSFFSSKFQRSIEEVMVSPTPDWVVILGYVLGGILRGVLVGIIVFAVSCFFAQPQIAHPGIILLFTLLTSVIFCLGGLLNGILARNFDEVAIFQAFVLTPLTYLGGVFYSIEYFSPFWRIAAKFNPILYMIDGFRFGFYDFSDVPVGISTAISLSLIVGLTIVNLYLLRKGVGLRN